MDTKYNSLIKNEVKQKLSLDSKLTEAANLLLKSLDDLDDNKTLDMMIKFISEIMDIKYQLAEDLSNVLFPIQRMIDDIKDRIDDDDDKTPA